MIKELFAAVFQFDNPIASDTVGELISGIMKWAIYIAVPIATLVIIYAGVILLTSKGVPDKTKKGKQMLTWAVAGLAVIFIGRGFVVLVQSILELAK